MGTENGKARKSQRSHEKIKAPAPRESESPDLKAESASKARDQIQRQMNEIQALKTELHLYQATISEASFDAFIITDKELKITSWNKAAEAMLGWSKSEVLGDQASPGTRSKILAALAHGEVIQQLTQTGSWRGETVNNKKDGTRIGSLSSIMVLWDNAGRFNGLAVSHHQVSKADESEAEAAEEEIQKRVKEHTEELAKANRILQQELAIHKKEALLAKESEGKNRDLVDNIKLGIFRCTHGPKGRFLEINRAMEEITGFSRDELLQVDVCALFVDSKDSDPFTNEVNITDWKVTRELLLKKKDGAEIFVAETVVAIRFESGAIQYLDGILEDINDRKHAQIEVQKSLQRLEKTIEEIIQAMAYIGEVRDPYTAGHQKRVAQVSFEMAKMMGLQVEQYKGLTMAAFVHDIGKILVPSDILSKPGRLTKPEFDLLKDHTKIGYEILKTIEFPWPIAKIVLQHHERMNGSGYPFGISGDEIIIEARILAVADVVEAMSSHRPYRPALGIDKALEEIRKNVGVLYDAAVVDTCVKLFIDKGFQFN